MSSPIERAVSDPVGLITDLVAAVEHQLTREQIRAVAAGVSGGRARSRRLAAALAGRPGVLADGRSPAPRVVGDLLVALRQAGAQTVALPCCARCGRQLRTLQRSGQDWYCTTCGQHAEPCASRPGRFPPATGPRSHDAAGARTPTAGIR